MPFCGKCGEIVSSFSVPCSHCGGTKMAETTLGLNPHDERSTSLMNKYLSKGFEPHVDVETSLKGIVGLPGSNENDPVEDTSCFECGKQLKKRSEIFATSDISSRAWGKPMCEFCYTEKNKVGCCFKCSKPVLGLGQRYITLDDKVYHEECYDDIKSCIQCSKSIYGRAIGFLDNHYHPNCFHCQYCRKTLDAGKEFFESQGEPVCNDCHKAGNTNRRQTLTHSSSASNDESTNVSSEQTKPYTVVDKEVDNLIQSIHDMDTKTKPSSTSRSRSGSSATKSGLYLNCYGCTKTILSSEDHVTLPRHGKFFHPLCFKCDACQLVIPTDGTAKFVFENGRVLHLACAEPSTEKDEQEKLICATCNTEVASGKFIHHKDKYYHSPGCFLCTNCSSPIGGKVAFAELPDGNYCEVCVDRFPNLIASSVPPKQPPQQKRPSVAELKSAMEAKESTKPLSVPNSMLNSIAKAGNTQVPKPFLADISKRRTDSEASVTATTTVTHAATVPTASSTTTSTTSRPYLADISKRRNSELDKSGSFASSQAPAPITSMQGNHQPRPFLADIAKRRSSSISETPEVIPTSTTARPYLADIAKRRNSDVDPLSSSNGSSTSAKSSVPSSGRASISVPAASTTTASQPARPFLADIARRRSSSAATETTSTSETGIETVPIFKPSQVAQNVGTSGRRASNISPPTSPLRKESVSSSTAPFASLGRKESFSSANSNGLNANGLKKTGYQEIRSMLGKPAAGISDDIIRRGSSFKDASDAATTSSNTSLASSVLKSQLPSNKDTSTQSATSSNTSLATTQSSTIPPPSRQGSFSTNAMRAVLANPTLLKFGGSNECPCCHKKVYPFEEAPGPHLTKWHRRCLVCRTCTKMLDSSALVKDVENSGFEIYCRTCFDKSK